MLSLRVWVSGLLTLLVCFSLPALEAQRKAAPIVLTPAVVVAGSPELVRVTAKPDAMVEGEWLGRKLEFFPSTDGRHWFALAGVDVEAPIGPSTLRIQITEPGGRSGEVSGVIPIHAAHYRTGSLKVAPKFVEPNPAQLDEIHSDQQLKERVFAEHSPVRLWQQSFLAPVSGPPTDSFGTRRVFNGKLASIHKGMDFRVGPGVSVLAGNRGRVVLAERLYYEGNCVIIDHGLGLWTIAMHLSQINVHVGQMVEMGQQVGLSGATGRVTGPHLHWAVRWQGAYLDPAKLLDMDLSRVQ